MGLFFQFYTVEKRKIFSSVGVNFHEVSNFCLAQGPYVKLNTTCIYVDDNGLPEQQNVTQQSTLC